MGDGQRRTGSAETNLTGLQVQGTWERANAQAFCQGSLQSVGFCWRSRMGHMWQHRHECNGQSPNWSQAGGNPKVIWLWNMFFVFIFDALGIQAT